MGFLRADAPRARSTGGAHAARVWIPGERIARELDELAETRGLPAMIVMDNGPEFAGKALDAWAYRRGVKLHFIAPDSPWRTPTWKVSTGSSATSA